MRILILAILLIITLSYYFYKKRNVIVEGAGGSCPCPKHTVWSNCTKWQDVDCSPAGARPIAVQIAGLCYYGNAESPSLFSPATCTKYWNDNCRGQEIQQIGLKGLIAACAGAPSYQCKYNATCSSKAPSPPSNSCCPGCSQTYFTNNRPNCGNGNGQSCSGYTVTSGWTNNSPCVGSAPAPKSHSCTAAPACTVPAGDGKTVAACNNMNKPAREKVPQPDGTACCGNTTGGYYKCGLRCNSNSTPNTSVPGVCECKPGYGTTTPSTNINSMNPPTCEQCIQGTLNNNTAGSYKSGSGNSACLQCPAHSYAVMAGATSIAACYCKPGFYMNNNTCQPVPGVMRLYIHLLV